MFLTFEKCRQLPFPAAQQVLHRNVRICHAENGMRYRLGRCAVRLPFRLLYAVVYLRVKVVRIIRYVRFPAAELYPHPVVFRHFLQLARNFRAYRCGYGAYRENSSRHRETHRPEIRIEQHRRKLDSQRLRQLDVARQGARIGNLRRLRPAVQHLLYPVYVEFGASVVDVEIHDFAFHAFTVC